MDDAANQERSGMRVVMVPPTGEKVKLALKLSFWASNNEAEYEAVLSGIKAARSSGAAKVILYSDSQLVVQQLQGNYEVKEEKLARYIQEVHRLSQGFIDWSI